MTPSFKTTDFYKSVLDITNSINNSISKFGFKLDYRINSKNIESIWFTISVPTWKSSGYDEFTFEVKSSDCTQTSVIVARVVDYVNGIIRDTIYKDVVLDNIDMTIYEDPDKLLEEYGEKGYISFLVDEIVVDLKGHNVTSEK